MKVARPQLTPFRPLLWSTLALLTALSVLWPASLPAEANLLALPGRVELDWFYNFWIPISRNFDPVVTFWMWLLYWGVGLTQPWWWVPGKAHRGAKAVNDEVVCTGCGQCYLDCPYEAIQMIPRYEGKGSDFVSHITPEKCVSCGICSGSCAPMVIGVPGRTGRDQLREAQLLRPATQYGPEDVVVFGCRNGIAGSKALRGAPHTHVIPINCSGELHTTPIEFLLRSGVGGVMVMSCPQRNCVHREGPRWIRERLFEDREAELKPRVDKTRVRLEQFGASDGATALATLQAFQAELARRTDEVQKETDVELDIECEPIEDLEELEASHG